MTESTHAVMHSIAHRLSGLLLCLAVLIAGVGAVSVFWLLQSPQQPSSLALTVIILVTMLAELVVLSVHQYLRLHLTDRIRKLMVAMTSLSRGQLGVRLNIDGHDEIARMGDLLAVFKQTILQERQHSEALREAKQFAEQAAKVRSQFLANMSHEIRTPLTAIIGFTDLANRMANGVQAEYLNKARGAARSLLSILNDILDFSKIEAGKMILEHTEFDLRHVLNDLSGIASLLAVEKQLDLLIEIDPQIPPVLLGDPLRLGQVLLNLTNNGIKFTEVGEVLVQARCVAMSHRHAEIEFHVKDTGIGLSEDQKKLLFQSFTQVDTSTTRRYGGTGLGLAISRQLVELMGSSIHVESHEGLGSDFYFAVQFDIVRKSEEALKIAAVEQMIAAKVQYQAPKNGQLQGARVLLVEDTPHLRELSMICLSELGMIVETACDGRQALDAIAKAVPLYDVVLMDVQMPEMDGLEATRRIREIHTKERLPIIAMTAHAMESERQKCLEAGMNDHLPKPIDIALLTELIAKYVLKLQPGVSASLSTGIIPPRIPADEIVRISGNLPTSRHEERMQYVADAKFAQRVASPAADPSSGIPQGYSLFPDMPGFDIPGALKRLGGRAETLRRALLAARKPFSDSVVDLRRLIAEENWLEAQRIVHTLVGSAGTLGATRVVEIARQWENELKLCYRESTSKHFTDLEIAMTEVLASLERLEQHGLAVPC